MAEENSDSENKVVVSSSPRFSKSKRSTLLLVMLVLIAGLVVVSLVMQKDPVPTVQPAFTPAETASVTITASGFVPATLKVKVGTIVSWKNTDTVGHSVVSHPHPTHTDLSDLKSEPLVTGQSYEYKFTKTGSFNYHDEQKLTSNAVVIVE